jgi:hypothetical protein
MAVTIAGRRFWLWRAVDDEGEVLDLLVPRFWWNRFGAMLAAEVRKRRVAHIRAYPQWR